MNRICSICQAPFMQDDHVVACRGCDAHYHEECWNEIRGCGTYGCKYARVSDKAPSQNETDMTYWGQRTKPCPACKEVININELTCPFCHEKFDTIAPLTEKDIRKQEIEEPQDIRDSRIIAVIIFAAGLLGVTAPFALAIGGIWYSVNRTKLRKSSPVFGFLALAGLGISIFYTLFILLGLLGIFNK